MKDYVLMNKDKLVRTFVWTSIILTLAFCGLNLYKCYYIGDCMNNSQIINGLLFMLFLFPTFATVFEIVRCFLEFKRTENFFDSEPINGLIAKGFKKDFNNKDSKWFLSQLIAVGQFDKYQLICELDSGRLRVIAKTNYDHLDKWDKNEIKAIQKSFDHVKFEYDGQGIATSLKVNKVKRMTLAELENYFKEFVKMLEMLKIK